MGVNVFNGFCLLWTDKCVSCAAQVLEVLRLPEHDMWKAVIAPAKNKKEETREITVKENRRK